MDNDLNEILLKKFMKDYESGLFNINGINLIIWLVMQIPGKSDINSIIYSKLFKFSISIQW